MERKAVAKVHSTPTSGSFLHRQSSGPRPTRHPVQDLQRSIGNSAVQRLINSPYIQTKLNVSSAGDQVEEESQQRAEDVMRMSVSSAPLQNAADSLQKKCPACEAGKDACPRCADNEGTTTPVPPQSAAPGPTEASPAVPMQSPPPPPPPPAYTYTFISRGWYGHTTPGFRAPSCGAGAAPGTATMLAGSANPVVSVYPNGTYQVRRNDGVIQTATCTRSAAGLAATTAHENSHAAGARAGAIAANATAGLPRNFTDTPASTAAAQCAAALPAVVTAWNTATNAVWQNEINHGPGTQPGTAQTFTEEHAAGSCTFV